MLHLIPLGIWGGFPASGGCTSGYLLHGDAGCIGLDLGSGCLGQLTSRIAPENLDALLLSHWHFDHASDVLPLLYRLQKHVTSGGKPLHIYAPADEKSPIRQIVLGESCVALHDIAPGDALSIGGFAVQVYAARHPVPGVMLRVTGDGKTFCYTGDTNTAPHLTEFARDADLLLADGLFLANQWNETLPHLSGGHVARLAVEANVKRALITHLSAGNDNAALLKEARAIRQDIELVQSGASYTV